MISDKKILLLDEITSHMDTIKEGIYCNELNKIKRGKIILLITHKESLIARCDRIIMIERKKRNSEGTTI